MQAQSWIPVSERLPGKKYWGKKILVIIDNQPSCQSYYGKRIGMTHWMPIILPEQGEPEQGEFTKEMREKYKYAIKNKLTIHISAYVKALNVIDRLGAENKKLVEGQKARKIAGS